MGSSIGTLQKTLRMRYHKLDDGAVLEDPKVVRSGEVLIAQEGRHGPGVRNKDAGVTPQLSQHCSEGVDLTEMHVKGSPIAA